MKLSKNLPPNQVSEEDSDESVESKEVDEVDSPFKNLLGLNKNKKRPQ